MTLTLLDPSPEEPDDDGLLTVPDGFPALPAAAVYHGLAGQIIDAIAPHTEVDPVAILTQLLVAFGAAVGRGAYFQVEATRHHPNEFLVLVGDSAKARKGSSWDHVRRLLDHADPTLATRTLTGLSSGEGLIWAVRDPTPTDPGVVCVSLHSASPASSPSSRVLPIPGSPTSSTKTASPAQARSNACDSPASSRSRPITAEPSIETAETGSCPTDPGP